MTQQPKSLFVLGFRWGVCHQLQVCHVGVVRGESWPQSMVLAQLQLTDQEAGQ